MQEEGRLKEGVGRWRSRGVCARLCACLCVCERPPQPAGLAGKEERAEGRKSGRKRAEEDWRGFTNGSRCLAAGARGVADADGALHSLLPLLLPLNRFLTGEEEQEGGRQRTKEVKPPPGHERPV